MCTATFKAVWTLLAKTIFEILKGSGRYGELEINPQLFLDDAIEAIKRTLNSLLVEGVKYEQINGQQYEMSLFRNEEIETYLSNLFEVGKGKEGEKRHAALDKTIFNYVPIDSQTVELPFAKDCEADPNVKFFFKLPRGFKIPTPIGGYRPDWAIIFENDSRVYFVVETKGTLNRQALSGLEAMKIECGEKH